jgi:hypothetical protein
MKTRKMKKNVQQDDVKDENGVVPSEKKKRSFWTRRIST